MAREIHGHEGSALNNSLIISADDRDESGGSHIYDMALRVGSGKYRYAGHIDFQRGPVKEAGLNGISDEALIAIVIDRLEGFQAGPFRSEFNGLVIDKLADALSWLRKRTLDRQARGVEGLNKV
jgi:hypothetical protein